MADSPVCGVCGAPVGDGARLDARCTRELAAALLQAASIAPDLDDAVAKQLRRGGGGARAKGHERPLPLDLDASDAAGMLRLELAGWLAAAGAPAALGGIAPMAMLLLGWLPELRQHPRAAEAHRGILGRVQRAAQCVDRLPERAPAGKCDQCGAQLLAELGADEVTCQCGMVTVALMQRRRERAAAADVLGTPSEIAGALRDIGIAVRPSTISSWGTRGQIEKRPGGFYRLSDVLAMTARRSS